MKLMDTAHLAEKVQGSARMELVLGQKSPVVSSGISRLDLQSNRAAVTTANKSQQLMHYHLHRSQMNTLQCRHEVASLVRARTLWRYY